MNIFLRNRSLYTTKAWNPNLPDTPEQPDYDKHIYDAFDAEISGEVFYGTDDGSGYYWYYSKIIIDNIIPFTIIDDNIGESMFYENLASITLTFKRGDTQQYYTITYDAHCNYSYIEIHSETTEEIYSQDGYPSPKNPSASIIVTVGDVQYHSRYVSINLYNHER